MPAVYAIRAMITTSKITRVITAAPHYASGLAANYIIGFFTAGRMEVTVPTKASEPPPVRRSRSLVHQGNDQRRRMGRIMINHVLRLHYAGRVRLVFARI